MAPYPTSGELAIDPRELDDEPALAAKLESASLGQSDPPGQSHPPGFAKPSTWVRETVTQAPRREPLRLGSAVLELCVAPGGAGEE